MTLPLDGKDRVGEPSGTASRGTGAALHGQAFANAADLPVTPVSQEKDARAASKQGLQESASAQEGGFWMSKSEWLRSREPSLGATTCVMPGGFQTQY